MFDMNLSFFAHKKGAGSTKNGRESESKRLGAKRADGQSVVAGNVLYTQRGTKVHSGENVGRGGDDTLFALVDGILKFERMGLRELFAIFGKSNKYFIFKSCINLSMAFFVKKIIHVGYNSFGVIFLCLGGFLCAKKNVY